MRTLRWVLAISTCTGLAVSAGLARADRVDGLYYVEASQEEVPCGFVEAADTRFNTGNWFGGTGTDGDYVELNFQANLPDSGKANERSAAVKQKSGIGMLVLIVSENEDRSLESFLYYEDCGLSGSLNMTNSTGRISVKCSSESLFSDLTDDQLASLETAFLDHDQIAVRLPGNGRRGSIRGVCTGDAYLD